MATEDDSEDAGGRVYLHLTEDQFEVMIERAAKAGAEAALDEAKRRFVYEVGLGVLKKVIWVVGAGLLAVGLWLAGRGEWPK